MTETPKNADMKHLKCLSRISCAMICQTIRDYTDTAPYYLSRKDFKVAELWLFNDEFPSRFPLSQCCQYINDYLEAIGALNEYSTGITVQAVRQKLGGSQQEIDEFVTLISSISCTDSMSVAIGPSTPPPAASKEKEKEKEKETSKTAKKKDAVKNSKRGGGRGAGSLALSC